MFAEYEEGRVGTMKGHTTNHANCSAFQVEILGYSAAGHEPWVGHFTDGQYQDLADFFRWSRERYGIGNDVTPTPAGGWRYGASSPYRLTEQEWDDFSGLTAHGAAPGNSHWDTGILDLQRIFDMSQEEPVPGEAPNIDEAESWARKSWQKAYTNKELVNDDSHPRDVVSKQELMVFLDRLGLLDA